MKSFLFLLGFLPACVSTKSSIPVDDSPVDSSLQPEETQPNVYVVEPCKISEAAFRGVGLGFPRSADRLRTIGTVKASVLFADFPDAPATETPQEIVDILHPVGTEFLRDVSYGKMHLELHPHPVWLRMSQPSSHYANAIREFAGHRDWLQEAIDLADAEVDFSDIELVFVLATLQASTVAYGPTWLGFSGPNGSLEADGVEIRNGITSGADLAYWGGKWLAHEVGHSMSLVDLYSYESNGGYSRPFSLMDLISSEAPEFFAYERWFLGWIEDEQIACVAETATETLTAVALPDGFKAIAIPVGENRLIVVESRRALGWDSSLSADGVVVYTVDTTIPSGFGTIQVENDRQVLQVGQSIALEGINITVDDSTTTGDTVTVSIP